jgi:hypothetical protein
MSKLAWYWHRLRAMSPVEVALHVRKKWRAAADAKRTAWPEVKLDPSAAFPKLPRPEDAPEVLRDALRRDAENILAGRWKFFGHLELQVDDPPKWQHDYLVRRDVETTAAGFKLDYRTLGDGVDSKVIWEPSRWHQLVRLAMAAYVLGEGRAAVKCVEWLEDWVKHNPPYRGWNWTSALEVGMRLVQFTWVDALIGAPNSASVLQPRLGSLRRAILPPHAWYAWRHKSFGSSANNHLIGELAGLILATVRWPALAQCGSSLEELQRRWEHEVLAQFAEDGGNKEQALNYHLFSWEFCWQARAALHTAGRSVSRPVLERLYCAANFFTKIQAGGELSDYGDSDSAFVTPLFDDSLTAPLEWRRWLISRSTSAAIDYWIGSTRDEFSGELDQIIESVNGDRSIHPAQSLVVDFPKESPRFGWVGFPQSGQWMCRTNRWTVRWDLSPLGYLATAAHGHLDAQQISIWIDEVAVVIDPGTGAYYGDKKLRNWLASRRAHNGPSPGGRDEWPKRLGLFLWQENHCKLVYDDAGKRGLWSLFSTPDGGVTRTVEPSADGVSILVTDCASGSEPIAFETRWQFAQESRLEALDNRRFHVTRHGVSIEVQVSADWAEVFCVTDESQVAKADPDAPLAGTVSPAFRKTVWAPYLKLVARPQGDKPCVFTTTFLASAHS